MATPTTTPCWRPMSEAPTDGSVFVWVSATRWIGGLKRPCDIDLHFTRLVVRDGYPVEERTNSIVNRQRAACGYWTTEAEWTAHLSSLGPWRGAPTSEEIVVFVTEREDGLISGAVGWWVKHLNGWASVNSGERVMHPGYLDGENTGLPPMRWSPLGSLWIGSR